MAIITDEELLGLAVASESLASVDAGVRTMHRETASARVLGPLAKRYDSATLAAQFAPATTAAGWACKGLAADIAGFTLLGHRGVSQQDATYQVIKDRHDAAIAWLALVTDGEGAELPGLEPTRGGPQVAAGAPLRWREGWAGLDCLAVAGLDIGDGVS